MTRSLPAALFGLVLTTAATAQPGSPLGKSVQVEFTERHPVFANVWREIPVVVPIEQGDKLRVEMEPVGGADMRFHVRVFRDAGGGAFAQTDESPEAGKIDFTTARGFAGRRAKVVLYSKDLGQVNVRITKIGINDPPPGSADPRDALIEKLRAENADLRKQLDGQKRQLDEILELLRKGKK